MYMFFQPMKETSLMYLLKRYVEWEKLDMENAYNCQRYSRSLIYDHILLCSDKLFFSFDMW